jgi:predicted Rossmann fold flavoprotein
LKPLRIVVAGGGAAGFFGAITAAEKNPQATVILLEKGTHLLAKVKISGGGRCNVTHACFKARELSTRYPRGGKALIGPLTRFGPDETVRWFESRGVKLKTESDGRMFPVTDSSESIVDCLTQAARQAGARDVIAVVQPHRYSRLSSLFNEFCGCFNDADSVIVAPVYAAGEAPIAGADHHSLLDGLRARGHRGVGINGR